MCAWALMDRALPAQHKVIRRKRMFCLLNYIFFPSLCSSFVRMQWYYNLLPCNSFYETDAHRLRPALYNFSRELFMNKYFHSGAGKNRYAYMFLSENQPIMSEFWFCFNDMPFCFSFFVGFIPPLQYSLQTVCVFFFSFGLWPLRLADKMSKWNGNTQMNRIEFNLIWANGRPVNRWSAMNKFFVESNGKLKKRRRRKQMWKMGFPCVIFRQ